jgi:hypothetical protein
MILHIESLGVVALGMTQLGAQKRASRRKKMGQHVDSGTPGPTGMTGKNRGAESSADLLMGGAEWRDGDPVGVGTNGGQLGGDQD